MSDRFPACLAFTLQEEGGYSNTPGDAGGVTMHGITLAVFRSWRHNPYATALQLRMITLAETSAIYAALYWQPSRCQDMPAGVDLMVFDEAVNAGVRGSATILQDVLGVVADGWIGPTSLAKLNSQTPAHVIAALSARQSDCYRALSNYKQFGRGWMARLQARQAAALHMAGVTGPAPTLPVLAATPSDDAATDALNAAQLEQLG